MWAVDLRQSHEVPKAWIENASDLNSVLGKKKRWGEKTPSSSCCRDRAMSGKQKPTENCGNRVNVLKKV